MTVDEFEADISVRGDELWVLPRGDLDIAGAPELEETLSLAMASDAKAIVIDLRGLEFVDSTGLRTLVQAPQAEGGERISFVAGNDHVQSVFRISGLLEELTFRRRPEEPAPTSYVRDTFESMPKVLVRTSLAGLTAVLAINLWTGAPIFAIWVGSRVQKGTGLTMSTVLVVMAVLAATVTLLVLALMRVEAAYKTVTGQETHRRTSPWLRSMRGERPERPSRCS